MSSPREHLPEEQVRRLDREYVLHSWSVQAQINPLPIAGAEGRHFWDYEGKRYLDFSSQLVNLNLGHQHPALVVKPVGIGQDPLADLLETMHLHGLAIQFDQLA